MGTLNEAAQALHLSKKRRRTSRETTPKSLGLHVSDRDSKTHLLHWKIDPYSVEPHITLHYLNLFFAHLNGAIQRMFPRQQFMNWVRTSDTKRSEELMLLYAILAAATNFSLRSDKKEEGKLFSEIAEQGLKERRNDLDLMLVQTHLFLGIYHLAGIDNVDGWDYCATAGRIALKLKLNNEHSISAMINQSTTFFRLDRFSLAECMRRTYWSIFLMDVSIPFPDIPSKISFCSWQPSATNYLVATLVWHTCKRRTYYYACHVTTTFTKT